MVRSSLITWENSGKERKYFDYQRTKPTSRRKTAKYEYASWGNKEHHWNGKFLQTRGYDPSIPGVSFESLVETYKDELKQDFTEIELNQLGDKNGDIISSLLLQWRKDFDISIYDNPYYVFESVSCGLNVTGMIEADKLRNTSPVFHTLMWWDHLDYKPKTILDVGAGVGLSAIWFAYHMPETEVYVAEVNELSIRLLERVRKDLGLKNLHFGDVLDEYDAATFYEVVEHIQSRSDIKTGAPFPWLDKYLTRIKENFVYSTYWTKYDTSVGHFNLYDFGQGLLNNPKTWGRNFHKEIVKRNWSHDRRHDFYGSLPNIFWKKEE
jgi:hypothetical protein